MKKQKMNKWSRKGDIPITILVLGVLAICLLAIFTFYFSDRNVKEDFVVLGAVEEAKLTGETIGLYRNLGLAEEQIKNFVQTNKTVQGNFVIVEREKITVRHKISN